jgi:hypothetical protein
MPRPVNHVEEWGEWRGRLKVIIDLSFSEPIMSNAPEVGKAKRDSPFHTGPQSRFAKIRGAVFRPRVFSLTVREQAIPYPVVGTQLVSSGKMQM